ncbi:peptide deformylase [Lentzea jiangxiensis]|uniref:Peptide deformylase n=1 Tax=Lentzea jiangxiensis TaxID=641025 RepID=A0A1H0W7I8_9PSEU|nr:peptide deformylase [Lentzea jiangxiensis]
MAMRDIRLFGDPVPTSPVDPVTRFDRNLEGLVADSLDTVEPDGRAGLVALRIGVGCGCSATTCRRRAAAGAGT